MKNHSEHVATENSNWYQHVSTCLNHMTAILREKTSLVKFVILPSESWTTRIWRPPITWSWGVHYMWGSDMLFPEPLRLKPCLTSWVTPFQTLQLHEKNLNMWPPRTQTGINMAHLNHMTAVLREKTSLVKHCAILPFESWTTRIWRLPINPAVLDCWVSGMYQGVTRGKGLQWSYLVCAVLS